MFVQLICKDRNEQEMNELYEVIGALCVREQVQVEERSDHVEILACPQGKIIVTQDDKDLILTANTRHGGPGFHAFVVDFFMDIQEEVPGEYALTDDLEYDTHQDFHRLMHQYEHELDYVKTLLLTDPEFRKKNYLFDETFYLPVADEGEILTSVGPIDAKKFAKTEVDDLMDYFYVWNDWDKNARFYRNAALTLLAKEGMGEFADMNDQSRKAADEIMDYLEIAHEKDPELPLPVEAYSQLADVLNRENKLKDAKNMDWEASSYRTREVYHLFEDARIAAPGQAERSYDPALQSLFLMAPYHTDSEWKWLIQASRQPSILPNLEEVKNASPIRENDMIYRIVRSEVDGVPTLNAIIQKHEQLLYIHAVARSNEEIPYLESCILHSGFMEGTH